MQIAEITCVPPGFRFHPTEEELVGYYLNRKVNSLKIDLDVIIDIDLYRIEPWDIQEKCNLGYAEQNEWYFFSFKDRKYPTGTRTNRATTAGFWKATGRDKAVLSNEKIIGMRKTLVFYKGRAPNGRKTDWIMHEYRLQTSEHGVSQEEGWVVCRAFKKPTPSTQKQPWNNNAYCLRSDNTHYRSPPFPITNNFDQPPFLQHSPFDQSQIVELPSLDSPSVSASFATKVDDDQKGSGTVGDDQYSEWKCFDKLLDSQVIESSSFAYTNMALLPTCDELDAQNRISNVLDCFSDL